MHPLEFPKNECHAILHQRLPPVSTRCISFPPTLPFVGLFLMKKIEIAARSIAQVLLGHLAYMWAVIPIVAVVVYVA